MLSPETTVPPAKLRRGSQGAGVEYPGAAGEVFWTPAEHEAAAAAAHEVRIVVARRHTEKIGGAGGAGDCCRQTPLKGSDSADRPVAEGIAQASGLKARDAVFIRSYDAVRAVEVGQRALPAEIELVAIGCSQILVATGAPAGFIIDRLEKV